MIELRPYQQAAIDKLYEYFSANDGNPLIVMPTGTGKSVVIAEFLRAVLDGAPSERVLVLTHVKELIAQNFAALIRSWPLAPAGIYSAGLNKRDINAQILFAGIQSIHKRAYNIQRCDLVLIDEAHLLGRNDQGTYRNFLNDLLQINPNLKVIGFTATPYRMDSGMLHEGKDRLFTDIAYDVPILKMIEQGYLSPVVPKQTKTQLDVSSVGKRGGEFIPGQLEAAVDIDSVNREAVEEIIAQSADRGSWLVFCSGVDHAHHIRDIIREAGFSCETVVGKTPAPKRDRILDDFKAGKLRALTNANVLTTGFDAPGTDLIALLRPTNSVGLYIQMIGRGTRLAEGKDNCLVLDFAGNTMRHGPIDQVDGRKKPKDDEGDGLAPSKTCPECQTINAASARMCQSCAYEFPPPKIKIDTKAASHALLSTQIKIEWLDVTSTKYALHIGRDGKPNTMRADYYCGMIKYSEWICFEHVGYPRQKATSWWLRRASTIPVPDTVNEALNAANAGHLKTTAAIRVRPQGKYFEILSTRLVE